MPLRNCDVCRTHMAPYMPRKQKDGLMLCPACLKDDRGGYVSAAKSLPKTQTCSYCDDQATKRLLWAEGMAYIPVCDNHEDKGRHRIEVTNKDEVVSTRPINKAAHQQEIDMKYAPVARLTHRSGIQVMAHDSGDGTTIYHCPFCLVSSTSYLTSEGRKTLGETAGTEQWVLSADPHQRTAGRWVLAHIHAFGQQRIMRITLTRNQQIKVLEATPEHRWLVKANLRWQEVPSAQVSRKGRPRDWRPTHCSRGHEFSDENTRVRKNGTRECKDCARLAKPVGGTSRATDREVLTADLRPGMRLSFLRQTGVGEIEPDEAGIRHGIVFGDGTAQGGSAKVDLWGEKDAQLLRYFPGTRQRPVNTADRSPFGTGVEGVSVSGGLKAWMKDLPSIKESPEYLFGFLAGYLAADGTVNEQGQAILSGADPEVLESVRDIAQSIGISSYGVTEQWREGFPGAGLSAIYDCEFLGSTLNPGLFLIEEHRSRWSSRDYSYDRFGWTVVSVEETDRIEDVYCAVVPETHSFALEDNIWTGNCGSGQVCARSDGTVECEFCFAGSVQFITRDGIRTFAEAVGTRQWVLTGDDMHHRSGRWVEAEIREFGEQPLYEVALTRSGIKKTVLATAEHRWFVLAGSKKKDRYREEPTLGLIPGHRLAHVRATTMPIGADHEGIRMGAVFGDGTVQTKNGQTYGMINLWGPKVALGKFFDETSRGYPATTDNGVEGIRYHSGMVGYHKNLPPLSAAPDYLYGWLVGYFATDGCASATGPITLSSRQRSSLEHVKAICDLLGIGTYSITESLAKGSYGGPALMFGLGLVRGDLNPEFFIREDHRRNWEKTSSAVERMGWTVESVRCAHETQMTYCAVVPETASFALADNIWVGNCHTSFTVQVQPEMSAFPQTINGIPVDVPGMPGEIGAETPMNPIGGDPGVETDVPGSGGAPPTDVAGDAAEEEDDSKGDGGNPFTSALKTDTGAELSPWDYARHVAVKHAPDRAATIAQLRSRP